MSKIAVATLVSSTVVGLSIQAQAATFQRTILIDDFVAVDNGDFGTPLDDVQTITAIDDQNTSYSAGDDFQENITVNSSIFGGRRTRSVQVNTTLSSGNQDLNSTIDSFFGEADAFFGSDIAGTFRLEYDGSGSGLGDLTQNQGSRFRITDSDAVLSDAGENLEIRATVSDGINQGQVSRFLNTNQEFTEATFEFVEFGSSVNFTSIDFIVFEFLGDNGTDLVLDNIEVQAAVPEPTTILGTMAALGFGAVFRRKQKQQQLEDKEEA